MSSADQTGSCENARSREPPQAKPQVSAATYKTNTSHKPRNPPASSNRIGYQTNPQSVAPASRLAVGSNVDGRLAGMRRLPYNYRFDRDSNSKEDLKFPNYFFAAKAQKTQRFFSIKLHVFLCVLCAFAANDS
jgi:hypothetical protein